MKNTNSDRKVCQRRRAFIPPRRPPRFSAAVYSNELQKQSKFTIVADERERKEMLAAMKKAADNPDNKGSMNCEPGGAMPPNTKLDITYYTQNGSQKLSLELFSLSKGCLWTSAVVNATKSIDATVSEAVASLLSGVVEYKKPLSKIEKAEKTETVKSSQKIVAKTNNDIEAAKTEAATQGDQISETPIKETKASTTAKLGMAEVFILAGIGVIIFAAMLIFVIVFLLRSRNKRRLNSVKTKEIEEFEAKLKRQQEELEREKANLEKHKRQKEYLFKLQETERLLLEQKEALELEKQTLLTATENKPEPRVNNIVEENPKARAVKKRVKGASRWISWGATFIALLILAAAGFYYFNSNANSGITWVTSKVKKLNGLKFSKSEVTVKQFEACVKAGKCKKDNYHGKDENKYCNWGYNDRGFHPMNCVDWYGADAFCKWAGGRLPTEDEWYAEADNDGARQYPWGNEESSCNYANSVQDGCGKNGTWPVCTKEAGNSVSGVCDMNGNVMEWASTESTEQDSNYVFLGDSLYDNSRNPYYLVSAIGVPSSWDYLIGFRCALANKSSLSQDDKKDVKNKNEIIDAETWTDPSTSLMWQVKPVSKEMKWQDAINYCENLNLGGYGDWRLPKINELESLITGCDKCKNAGENYCHGCRGYKGQANGYYQSNQLQPISNNDSGLFYSSSSSVGETSYAWYVDFGDGGVHRDNKMFFSHRARCVR